MRKQHGRVVDSGTPDHTVVNKKWLRSPGELNTTVTNPVGGKTKVLGIGEVEVLVRDVEGGTKLLALKTGLYGAGRKTILISVSSIIDYGNKAVHEKKNHSLCLKNRIKSDLKRKFFLFTLEPKATSPLR